MNVGGATVPRIPADVLLRPHVGGLDGEDVGLPLNTAHFVLHAYM
jgi:hypothetical protein